MEVKVKRKKKPSGPKPDRRRRLYRLYSRVLAALVTEFTRGGQAPSASTLLLLRQLAEASALRELAFREVLMAADQAETQLVAERLNDWDAKVTVARQLIGQLTTVLGPTVAEAESQAGFATWFAEAMHRMSEQPSSAPAPTDTKALVLSSESVSCVTDPAARPRTRAACSGPDAQDAGAKAAADHFAPANR